MSFLKHAMVAAAVLLITPAVSFAATETKSITVNVSADVPNVAGLQVSTPDGWEGLPQNLPWDTARQVLGELTGRVINVKSPAAITAYLSAPAQMASAADVVDLAVKLDNVVVPATAAAKITVANAAQAASGKSLAFAIAPTEPGGGYKQGTYGGQFHMIFESDI
ncbi:CS1 type fimbrial major subunit [Stenotrophomonas sp. MYb57]|uniref:CS1 type fimbrial major subunit n=1 Tax=Stenotrophomonas sp. MYb57 TaxID=1827305 RepID=UPI001F384BF8|nr:CS1 type fimbrial major subunit [Stenotrophomonas sp. MYb57]